MPDNERAYINGYNDASRPDATPPSHMGWPIHLEDCPYARGYIDGWNDSH